MSPTSVFAYYSAAHEMGHQFGATHTFNATSGTCGAARTASTAYEPVNGSTIMAYRFACAPEDMMSTDTYFHSASIEQIVNFTTGVTGNSCAARSTTGNNPPVVNAGPAFTIPMSTPFILTATGSDPDGDALTFSWEEFDLGTAAPPSTDDGTRPIFRSFLPTSNPARTFPRLTDVLSGFQTLGESLPTTTRTMNFRVTARDNRTGGGGVNFAATQVNVRADSGPFTVTQPTSSNTWPTGSTQTVTWNVANTNSAPVSCANVKITLSTDGGTTFPIILANNTPNDGSETVTIPGTPASGARVKVEAVGNIFFNLSQGFTVSGSANTTPTISGFTPASGAVGDNITINGTNFISPSAVKFSGVNASFTVNSTTQITATVPSGATSGPITVTTSSGTATSPTNFIVAAPVTVSGQVKDGSNNPVSGVLITFDMDRLGTPSTTSTTTDASGNYASADLGCQNRITVTPSKGALSFSPTSISFVSNPQCVRGPMTANFTASAPVNTIQFSAPNYPVSEATPDAIVTVTRTGNTSAAATVNYATSDTSGANNCNVVNGAASSRCDYLATLGTLQFGANETSKTISIPIVDDSWKDDTETFTITLGNPTGATLGTQASATVTIADNDTANGTNPIDATSFFVRQHYIDFLNREPDTSGLNFWINNIDGCSPKPSCTEIQRINTSAAFFLSIEFQDTGYFVYRAYKAAYGDATGTSTTGSLHNLSVPIIRLIEFLPDTQRIGQGVIVGQGNWQQQIDANKTAFTEEFVQRPRFLTDYPLSLTPTQFVNQLNTRAATAGVMPLTPAERDAFVTALTNGTKTRSRVLREVAENQTLSNAEFNRAFVLMQFFGYLRRNPNDPQDTDYAGYEFWLGKLNQFNGNFVNAEMVKAFITSGEYRARFGP
ncbi:MAG TPA: Calx-beta domain-containing protein [Pyrinomonadaceae bacterium]|nr:Calx-beta domain-containing protein [Pyrinomonadaceae bacterium]